MLVALFVTTMGFSQRNPNNTYKSTFTYKAKAVIVDKIEKAALFDAYKNKALRPSAQEINQNSRARSAKLRFAIRSSNEFKYPQDMFEKFKKYLDLEEMNV